MFEKILIANRGEIACRVIRTARRLGIKTVAVYSEPDARALHVAMADEAVAIGPAAARESYLNIARILDAAKQSGATAIHPGYGFLSESADFAAACATAGVVFVGPSAAAIRAMGSKSDAKRLMEKAGVPLVPGYHGDEQSDAHLAKAARAIGYPVLIKASAGGGGKGMRIVKGEAELAPALAAARREAASAFGDGRLLLEKYLIDPRHIEVQVFADRHGNVVHLFERDCSIQRRHQKLIEEAPAPGLTEAQRQKLGALAVKATRAVDYLGAGTIEFVAAQGKFHFIEMNTRLQVEHVATEMITGLDLVEWQLRVAAGERLPLDQAAIERQGHAIEARLYAEDPARDFLPAAGRLDLLRFPAETSALRVETGFRQSDWVTPYYDALIAKLIAWGANRGAALQGLQAALRATKLAGIASNRDFLLRIVSNADFAAGAQDTGFIARHRAALLPEPEVPIRALIAASLALLLERRVPQARIDVTSPWHSRDFWRLVVERGQWFRFHDGAQEHGVRLEPSDGHYRCEVGGQSFAVSAALETPDDLKIALDGEPFDAAVARFGSDFWIVLPDETQRLHYLDPLIPAPRAETGAGKVVSPMPGKVTAILVEAGAVVTRGQVLMQLEAMKMELAITAPADGKVAAIHVAVGSVVEEGMELVALATGT
jgi:3-methylcrotonyl-CoA carboxylase alpha subunit